MEIALGDAILRGDLELVPGAVGLVLFVHGSGSRRFSSRNRAVAEDLRYAGLATLLFDLLTAHFADPLVTAPTLLIVGGGDQVVIGMNQRAFAEIAAPKELCIVPGASHLFEEPGTLEEVSRLAREWFRRHLGSGEPG